MGLWFYPKTENVVKVSEQLLAYSKVVDFDKDGFTLDVDCNDSNNLIYPGATELCDSVDNDCDGQVDEDDVCCRTGADGIITRQCNGRVELDELNAYIAEWYRCSSCITDLYQAIEAYFSAPPR